MEEINDIKISQSKGGDKKRSSTSIILILIIFPLLFLACILPIFVETTTWKGFGILVDIYLFIFLSILGVILTYGVYESVNFIIPKKENFKNNMILFISLSLVVLIPFILQSLSLLGILSNNNKLALIGLLIMGLIIFLVISSVLTTDFKDISVLIFMTIMMYLFISLLAHNILVNGWQIVALILILTIVSDVSSYLGGKKYGTKKIFPKISPNKTVEGFVIGMMSAITFGIIFFITFFTWESGFIGGEITSIKSNNNMWILILIIIITSIISPFGDLTFSKIKRSYDKKDFSNILPGHGGLFDRIDSHIFTMTTSTLLIMILL